MLTSPKFRNSQRLQAAARNSPLLKSPEQGEAVRLLQEALLSLGYSFPQSTAGGRLDGIYGNETIQKVAQFQRAQGMMVDGVAGKQTLERLDALISGGTVSGQTGGTGTGWGERVGGGGGSGSGSGGTGSSSQSGGDPRHSGLYIRQGMAVVCPHHGRVVGSVIPGTDLISGSSGAMVMGCVGFDWRKEDRRPSPDGSVPDTPMPYGPPVSFITHCRSAQWTNVDYRNLVNGHPPVLRTSPGWCYLQPGEKINGSNQSGPILVISG
ncbi:MAG: peptidoglycan-binding protein [Bryobacteraceae bacterium]|nr:peptidoglycan-binding protein [Bryobacteraceae bacterium]